jgi:hypothetical protein
VTSIKVYGDIIHRLDWQWSWQQNLVHGRLFFICFPYVRTCAARLLLILLSAQSDRFDYSLLMILGIFSWLSGLTRYGVLANGLDPVGVHPWWSVSTRLSWASVPCWLRNHYHTHMVNLAPSLWFSLPGSLAERAWPYMFLILQVTMGTIRCTIPAGMLLYKL